MFYWGGEKYGIKIKSDCEECDINTVILREMEKNEFADKPVEVIIKPWLSNIWTSLKSGGWHAPVILVNNKVFSQGVVTDREGLSAKVDEKLAS